MGSRAPTLEEVLLDPKPLRRLLEQTEDPAVLAVVHSLVGEPERAEEDLARGRAADAPRIDEAVAWVALAAGDPARAGVAASRGAGPLAQALAAEALLRLRREPEARDQLARAGDHPLAVLVAAELNPEDPAALASAPAHGVLGARARRQRAAALLRSPSPDATRAHAELSTAAWHLLRLGAIGELGRCYLAMAEVEVADSDPTDPEPRQRAAQWLARAHPLLHRGGSTEDLETLRRAFRRYGRRAIDRLVDEDLEKHIEGVRRDRARVRDLLTAAADRRERGEESAALDVQILDALEEVGGTQEQLIASLEQLVVDRERLGQLVAVCRKVFLLDTEEELDGSVAELALELGGQTAALYDLTGSEVREVARAGPPFADPRQITATARRADEARGPRTAEDGEGSTQVIPLGQRRRMALAVRRPASKARIGTDDTERLQVFVSVVEAAYVRARHAAAVREAAARDAATLEAIREGVVTLDEEGLVRTTNATARQLLGIEASPAQRRLRDVPGLRALADAIERGVEDDAVPLPRVEVLVRAKRYPGGVVATLRELQSAQRLAQKLVGTAARFTFEDLVGQDPAFLDTLADARRVAATDAPVLITGESGTGKELVAQAVHNESPRSHQPFVGLNVAAIPRELLESELLGYERGAFTGARARGHAGRFELADRGTVLLDEIGDMPYEMQAKMLRVLQERVVQRLGGTREIPVRARIVATTHRDLEQAVEDGAFRLDLFYRLRVVHLKLPPLRERKGDVRLLVERYLLRHAERTGRPGIRVAPEVMRDLERYDWPGNVRELSNLVEGVVALLPPDATVWRETPNTVRRALLESARPSAIHDSAPPAPLVPERIEPLEDVERRAVEAALRACEGNVAMAARALGVARQTLYNKIKRWSLR